MNPAAVIGWSIAASFLLALAALALTGIGIIAIAVGPLAFVAWFFTRSSWARERRARTHAEHLVEQLRAVSRRLPCSNEFTAHVLEALQEQCPFDRVPCFAVVERMAALARNMYEMEDLGAAPGPPARYLSVEGGRYADEIARRIRLHAGRGADKVMAEALVEGLAAFLHHIPTLAFELRDDAADDPDGAGHARFVVPIADVLPDGGQLIEDVVLPFYSQEARDLSLFSAVREQLDRNLAEVSGQPYFPGGSFKATMPTEAKGQTADLAHAYLKHTPFLHLFFADVPLRITGSVRFEHQWVVAPSGTGKTTLLQTQIVEDLERVQRGECSIIVIDSQNQLIPKIARLKLFAPGQPLDGKLVVIEPDPDYPPALNVLDIGLADLSARDRYRMQAEALENVKACMATMADTQDDMLSYIVELCFVIPSATIQTIVDILKPNGLDAYREYLDDVDQTCRDYFETAFTPRSQSTTVTKDALIRRLMGMLRNPTFRRMFLNKRGTFNMAKELKTPKVILINTDLEFLRHDACQLFGRYFIAQLLQAAETRGEKSMPVFCYIDECQDYISNDDNAAKLMDKARKRRVGMIFAHQRLANIESNNVRDALANVGVRFAGGNETDASYLSKILRCEPEFIASKTRGIFACFVRRQTQQAIEVHVPPDALERMEQMSNAEYAQIRQEMRERYSAQKPTKLLRPPPPPANDPTPASPPTEPAAAPKTERKLQARRTDRLNPDSSKRTRPTGDWEP